MILEIGRQITENEQCSLSGFIRLAAVAHYGLKHIDGNFHQVTNDIIKSTWVWKHGILRSLNIPTNRVGLMKECKAGIPT